MKNIQRNTALADMDIRYKLDGTRRTFSIKFVSMQGKLYYFPNAFACGCKGMDMKANRVRGVQPCDCKGNPEGHVYPVKIDNIIEYKGLRITFHKDGDTI